MKMELSQLCTLPDKPIKGGFILQSTQPPVDREKQFCARCWANCSYTYPH
jgi:hypothetical protein